MAGSDETMRLVAELLDKTSGPLKEIQKQLKVTSDIAKGSHTEAGKAAIAHDKAMEGLRKQVGETGRGIKEILTPAFAALGLTVFGVGEGMAKMVESLKRAAEQYDVFTNASRRASMSVGDLRVISATMDRLGVPFERGASAAADFAGHLDRMRRGNAEELTAHLQAFNGELETVGKRLLAMPNNAAAWEEFTKIISNPNMPPDQKDKLIKLYSQPLDLAQKSAKEFQTAIKESLDEVAAHPESMENMERLNTAFAGMRANLRGLDTDFIREFGGAGAASIERVAQWIKDIDDSLKQLSDFMTKLGTWDKEAEDFQNSLRLPGGQSVDDWKKEHEEQGKAWGSSPLLHPDLNTGPAGESRAKENAKESVYVGALRALREWWATATGGDGSGLTSGTGTGTLFRPGVRSEFRGGPPSGSGSRGNRNNNRGNIKFGSFAKEHGATGADDKGFAIFPDQATGDAAQAALLQTSGYQGLTLHQFAQRYAEGSRDWERTVGGALGLGAGDIVNPSDPRLLPAIRKAEGTDRPQANRMSGPIGQDINQFQTGGGHSFAANSQSGAAFKGFLEELEGRGAPFNSVGGYNARKIAGTSRWSQHAYGNAIDVDQLARGQVTKQFGDWAKAHPLELSRAMKRWNMKDGGDFGDFGHFEYGGHAPALDPHGAALRDHIRNRPLRSGMGDAPTKVTGDASLRIDLNGFPRGTRFASDHDGLFSQVQINRGRPMEIASETS